MYVLAAQYVFCNFNPFLILRIVSSAPMLPDNFTLKLFEMLIWQQQLMTVTSDFAQIGL